MDERKGTRVPINLNGTLDYCGIITMLWLIVEIHAIERITEYLAKNALEPVLIKGIEFCVAETKRHKKGEIILRSP